MKAIHDRRFFCSCICSIQTLSQDTRTQDTRFVLGFVFGLTSIPLSSYTSFSRSCCIYNYAHSPHTSWSSFGFSWSSSIGNLTTPISITKRRRGQGKEVRSLVRDTDESWTLGMFFLLFFAFLPHLLDYAYRTENYGKDERTGRHATTRVTSTIG